MKKGFLKVAARHGASALLLLVVVAALWHGAAQAQSMDYVVARDTPPWFKQSFLDFGEDVAEAAADGRRVMVYFGQDGCPYCRKLHDAVFDDAALQKRMRAGLDSVAINMFGDVETLWVDGEARSEKALAAALGVQFTPTLLFLDEDGAEILRMAGYQPPDRFGVVLDYVLGRQEAVPFAEFLRAREAAAASAGVESSVDAGGDASSYLPAGEPVAVLVTRANCDACDEWRAFLQDGLSAEERAARPVHEVDLLGADAVAAGVSEAQWAAARGLSFAPALLFLDADGEEQFRADGYLRAFHLRAVWEYVTSGAYLQEPEFQRFLHERAERLRAEGEEVRIW